jgi:hypothetical protein
MTQKKIAKPSAKAETRGVVEVGDELIAVRAFERWMGRGCPVSDGVEDWVAARQELEAELFAGAAKHTSRGAPAKLKAAQAPASMH